MLGYCQIKYNAYCEKMLLHSPLFINHGIKIKFPALSCGTLDSLEWI